MLANHEGKQKEKRSIYTARPTWRAASYKVNKLRTPCYVNYKKQKGRQEKQKDKKISGELQNLYDKEQLLGINDGLRWKTMKISTKTFEQYKAVLKSSVKKMKTIFKNI